MPSPSKPEPVPVRRRKARGCGGLFFVFMLIVAAAWGGGLGVFVWMLEETQDQMKVLDTFRPRSVSKVYSADGELLGEFTGPVVADLVNLNEIPLHLQKAFVATEDSTFYEHKGVRPLAMASAVLDFVRRGRTRGASTITQQIARNIEELAVGTERDVWRKIREALISFHLEREYTKDEILELYLNQIYLGGGARGVEAAARLYYGKSCRDVDIAESALLAGLTRAPSRNEPFNHPDAAMQRRDIVLYQMLENKFITEEEYNAALAKTLEQSLVKRGTDSASGKAWAPNQFRAAYLVDQVKRTILSRPLASQEELFEEGLQVFTTVDMRLQRAAEEALFTAMDEFDRKKLAQLTRAGKADEFHPISGAIVCLDNRPGFKGYVRAMVGGRDFRKEQFNTAAQAVRQPGSGVKPFVWAAAIDNGMTAADIVVDEPVTYYDALGRPWSPQNFSGKYSGAVTLRYALEHSINIVSVKLTDRVGPAVVRSYIQRAGVQSPFDENAGLTIALGTWALTPLEQAVAYSTFANLGELYEPVYITEIRDRDDFVRYRGGSVKKADALPADVAYVMTRLMEGVCTSPGATAVVATKDLKRPRAGKTGTTNNAADVWFNGFTPDYTCVVWLGYRDANRPLGSGSEYTGGRLAAPIWAKFMIKAHEGMPVRDFTVPPGVEFFDIDRGSGLAGGGFSEAFIRGTRPRTVPEPVVSEGVSETNTETAPLAPETPAPAARHTDEDTF